MSRLTPPAYLCRRCGKTGHWTNNCRSNNPYVKSSKGIPRSFMVPVDGPEHKGALLTSSGEYVVPLIDYQAYKVVKKEKPPFLPPNDPVPEPEVKIPEEFLCVVCKDFIEDAVIIPCCGNSFCDECVRQILLDSHNHECPVCHDIDVSPDTLVPNRSLRTAVLNFKNKSRYTTVKTAAFVKQNMILKNHGTEKKVSNTEFKSAEADKELTKINQNPQDISRPSTPLLDEPADEDMFDNRPFEGKNLEEYISNKENYEIGHNPVGQQFDAYNRHVKYHSFYDRPSRNSRNDPNWQHQDSYPSDLHAFLVPPALSPVVYSLPNVSMPQAVIAPPEVYPAHPLPPGVSPIDTSYFSARPSPPGVRPFLVSPRSNETYRPYTSPQTLVNCLEAFEHDLDKQHRERNGDYISGSESGSSGFYGSSALSYSSKSSSQSLRRSLLGTPMSRRSRSRSYSYSRSRSRSKTRTYSRTKAVRNESRSRIRRYSRERVHSTRHKTVHSRQEGPISREQIQSRRSKHKCKRHRALPRKEERKKPKCVEVMSNKAQKTPSVSHSKLNLQKDFEDLNFEPDYEDFSDLEEN